MKKLLLLLLFIPLVSFGQDKYTGLGGYLKVTEDKIKVDKIIPLMELCHHLTDEMDLGRIKETHS